MTIEARRVELAAILPLRGLFLQEANCQIRYDACHRRGWTDSYRLDVDGRPVGYGSVKGQERDDRDTVFEFYVTPPYRKHALGLFGALLAASGCRFIETQSNLPLLTAVLHEFTTDVASPVILFDAGWNTELCIPDAVFRPPVEGEPVFDHADEPVGSHVLEVDDDVVATGGFLLHYNEPFADLFMEVRPDMRRRGFGAFLIQELKRECYLAGRVPAARCNRENHASRATLRKAGLRECGCMLIGRVRGAT